MLFQKWYNYTNEWRCINRPQWLNYYTSKFHWRHLYVFSKHRFEIGKVLFSFDPWYTKYVPIVMTRNEANDKLTNGIRLHKARTYTYSASAPFAGQSPAIVISSVLLPSFPVLILTPGFLLQLIHQPTIMLLMTAREQSGWWRPCVFWITVKQSWASIIGEFISFDV